MVNRHRAVSMTFNGSHSIDDEKKTHQSLSELRSVYKDIRYDWPQLVQGELTPIEMAIAFLDDTSVGLAHRKAAFDELCETTAKLLRTAVVENHDTFNNSVGLYHLLLSIAKESQEDSTHIKQLIETSTRDMNDRSHYLRELDNSSTKYAEMIDILDAMESLHTMPEQIEKLISEKKIHEVYDLISEGYSTAAKYNLWSLSAMNATQSYLEMQSNNLYDMIVDELRNEIYLKNVSLVHLGKDTWSSLAQSNNSQIKSFRDLLELLTSLELYIYNSANLDIQEITDCFTELARTFFESQLPKLHAHYSKHEHYKIDYSILLESALNLATESLYYIYMLLSTASKLNKLQPILEILATTIQLELHSLINLTTDEIKLKNYAQLAKIAKVQSLEHSTSYDRVSAQTFSDASVPILQDLFGTFYVKCLVVLMRHKVVHQIVQLIEGGRNLTSSNRSYNTESLSSTYDFKNVWEVIKKEINTFTLSYIYDDLFESRSQSKIDNGYSANKLNLALARNNLFQFDNVSYDSSSTTSENLKQVLDEMFPGFSVGNQKNNGNEESPYITSERYNSLVEILVPKNIYNMRIILEFVLIFTAGAHQLFTDFDKSKGTSLIAYQYFYDFMKNSFLKKLQEELNHSLVECLSGDSQVLIADPANPVADVHFDQTTVSITEPGSIRKLTPNSGDEVYSNAVKFQQLFTHACHTLNTSFAYRKDFSDTVLNLLETFANGYENHFLELIASGTNHGITEMRFGINDQSRQVLQLNQWMRTPALMDITGEVLSTHDDLEQCQAFIEKEIELMFYHSVSPEKIFNLSKEDTLDDEWFKQVCNFLLTAGWILEWLPKMRKESDYSIVSSKDGEKVTEVEKLKFDWAFLENGRSSYSTPDRISHEYLTLNHESIARFDYVIEQFMKIRDSSLIALRYDIRLKALYHIGKSFKDQFVLPTEPADADQYVTLYNKELYYVGTKIHHILSVEENACVFVGLPAFINKAFLKGSELIKIINGNGIKRILLNILTSQQMLRSILKLETSVDLSKASKYFELFTVGEHKLMERLDENREGFQRSEALNLLRLIYSEKLATNASSFNKTKFNELSRKINEVFNV